MIEKKLALCQHLGIDYFNYNEEYYIGSNQDKFDEETSSLVEEEIEKLLEDYLLVDSEINNEYDNTYNYEKNEYLIVTDEEAEEEWENNLDNYIEECVLPELPKQYRYYFDEDSFKRDCKYDGRGHSLASYDGRENEEIVGNIYYYIYRIN